MKRVGVLILLPFILFALERVNLIKDHSFEKDNEVWHTRMTGSGFPDIFAEVSSHDSGYAYTGYYSGSGDTRQWPDDIWLGYNENTYITQGFNTPKSFEDIDSICMSYAISPRNGELNRSYSVPILLHLNAHLEDYWKVGYILKAPDISGGSSPPLVFLKLIDFPVDTLWHSLEMNIYKDVEEWQQIPLDATLDSIILWCIGTEWDQYWRGQKAYFDDVRLMGYADYDVGIKAILDSVEDLGESSNANSPQFFSYYSSPYTPSAHIKNFGREPADSFLVIAEISKDETIHYADTMPWSLPADTDDTMSFSEFVPSDTGIYTLRIYTVMEPDESDADDELSKELDFTAIVEPVTPITHLSLDVDPLTSDAIHVSYALPESYAGTLTLFDLSGRRVDAKQVRGYGCAIFSGELSAGVYLMRLQSGNFEVMRKVVVVQ